MRIAIYGGSFNPMHIGHEKIVDYVLNNLNMDKIIIIPVGIPSHRENNLEQSDTRLKICKEIFKGNKKIEVSDIEIKSEGKSYTYDTLLKLIDLYGENNEFFEIIGEDSLKSLKLICISFPFVTLMPGSLVTASKAVCAPNPSSLSPSIV